MKSKRITGAQCIILMAVLVFGAGFIATDAGATNGYFANGYSIEDKAMGGAGVALPEGSLDASVNPALMAFVGQRVDVSLSLFNPNREYSVEGPGFLADGTVKSDSKFFLIPAIGANWAVDKVSFGISVFGNGGMNTNYDNSTFKGSKPTGVDLMQLFVVPTLAVKVAQNQSIGISPIIAYQRFEARGLEAFSAASSDSGNLTNNGHDNTYGFGGRIGYYGELLPFLNVGASYQTKVWMSSLDKYAGLFADHGNFDIPANWTIGVAVKPMPTLALLFDVQKIYYSDVKSIGNSMKPLSAGVPLGSDGGAGFGWHDMTIYKTGIQWASSQDWTWRAGYSYGKQPIQGDDVMFNILAPGVIEQHATVGLTRAISKTQDLGFSLVRAFSKTVDGTTPAIFGGQKVDLKMNQWEGTLGYTWKF